MNRIDQIIGPVIPIPVPFTHDFELDLPALEKYVGFLCRSGISNIMTTVGTSRFNLLTVEEILRVNACVIQACSGNVNSIVACPSHCSTKTAIKYGLHAQELGASFYLAYYPERYYGDEYIYGFFQELSKNLSIPILIHEMPMRNGLGPETVQYSLDLLDQLLEIPGICGLKEESLDENYSRQIVEQLADKAIIIGAGGGMSRYLRDFSLGAKTFLGGIGNIYPQMELDFFQSLMRGDVSEATIFVKDYELPFFQSTISMGWHPCLKAALSLGNLLPPYERPPMKQIKGDQLLELKKSLDEVSQYAKISFQR